MTTETAVGIAVAGPFVILALALPMLLKWRRLVRRSRTAAAVLLVPKDVDPADVAPQNLREILEHHFYPARVIFRFTTEHGRPITITKSVRTRGGGHRPLRPGRPRRPNSSRPSASKGSSPQ